jgi:hypothetical protein
MGQELIVCVVVAVSLPVIWVKFALSQLSEAEREAAACCALYYYTRHESVASETPFEQRARRRRRDEAATDLMRRHLVCTGGHVGQAVRNCRSTVQFREQFNVNSFRSSFLHQRKSQHGATDEKTQSFERSMKVSGFDSQGRVNIHVMTRSMGLSMCSLESTIFTLEKALACYDSANSRGYSPTGGLKSRDSSDCLIMSVDFQGATFVPWCLQLLGMANE